MKGNLVDGDQAGGGRQHPLLIRLSCLIGEEETSMGHRVSYPELHSTPLEKTQEAAGPCRCRNKEGASFGKLRPGRGDCGCPSQLDSKTGAHKEAKSCLRPE